MSPSTLDTVEGRKIRYAQELAAYSFRQFQSACQEAEACQRQRELVQQKASGSPSSTSPAQIQSHRGPRAGTDGDARSGEGEYGPRGSGGRVVGTGRSTPPSDPTTPKERKNMAGIIQMDYGASVDGQRGATRDENR